MSSFPQNDFSSLTLSAPALGRRAFLSGVLAAGATGVLSAADTPKRKDFQWHIVPINQRDYVPVRDIKDFYLFPKMERTGRHVWLRTDTLSVKLTEDSDDLFMNDVKFCMSLPTLVRGKDILVSRMDLAKLIEPVLRPRLIDKPIVFDTIVLDAGHGGKDPGSPGVKGYSWEKDYTLDMVLRLKPMLEAKGLKIILTRSSDKFMEKEDRTKIANAIPSSIFVSVHFNSGHSSANGIETYALSPHGAASTDQKTRDTDLYDHEGNDRDSENIALATAVHAMVIFRMKCQDRGIRRARWTVLTGLQRAGILFEAGFISSPQEVVKIHTPSYRQDLATSMVDGIMRYREVLVNRRNKGRK